MLHQKIYLSTEKNAYLLTYIHEHYSQDWEDVGEWLPQKRPAIIILPGGGYSYCSEREGEPVAYPFLSAGYDVFILFTALVKSLLGPHLLRTLLVPSGPCVSMQRSGALIPQKSQWAAFLLEAT